TGGRINCPQMNTNEHEWDKLEETFEGVCMGSMTVEQALAVGLGHHGGGRLEEGEGGYREILKGGPGTGGGLDVLGGLGRRVGEGGGAEGLVKEGGGASRGEGVYGGNLARLLMEMGRHGEAAEWMAGAARLMPGNADVWFDLGVAMKGAGRMAESEGAYREAV